MLASSSSICFLQAVGSEKVFDNVIELVFLISFTILS